MKTKQPTVRHAWIAALVLALIVGFTLGVRAHDPKLDEADLALEKAQVLLEAAQLGTEGKQQREFEKFVGRAIQDIEDARSEVAQAALVSDTP